MKSVATQTDLNGIYLEVENKRKKIQELIFESGRIMHELCCVKKELEDLSVLSRYNHSLDMARVVLKNQKVLEYIDYTLNQRH